MYEIMKWKRNPGKFKEWEWGDEETGESEESLSSLIDKIVADFLEKRIDVIFGENGLRPDVMTTFGRDDTPIISFCIDDESGNDPVAKLDLPFEKMLHETVAYALEYSDGAPLALRAILEKAIREIDAK